MPCSLGPLMYMYLSFSITERQEGLFIRAALLRSMQSCVRLCQLMKTIKCSLCYNKKCVLREKCYYSLLNKIETYKNKRENKHIML